MKTYLLPLAIFILGLAIAEFFFDIDISDMFDGFGEFISGILKGKDG